MRGLAIIFALGFLAVRSPACLAAAFRVKVMTSPQYQAEVRVMPELPLVTSFNYCRTIKASFIEYNSREQVMKNVQKMIFSLQKKDSTITFE